MALDPVIREAIRKAVTGCGQSDNLSNKLVAWIEAAASGEISAENPGEMFRYLDIVFAAIQVTTEPEAM